MQEEWPLKYFATCLIFQKVEARPLLMVRTNVTRFTTILTTFASICVQKTKVSHEIVGIQESI